MGGVPKRHKTSSKVRLRRANLKLENKSFQVCENCKGPIISHKSCAQCGNYSKKK